MYSRHTDCLMSLCVGCPISVSCWCLILIPASRDTTLWWHRQCQQHSSWFFYTLCPSPPLEGNYQASPERGKIRIKWGKYPCLLLSDNRYTGHQRLRLIVGGEPVWRKSERNEIRQTTLVDSIRYVIPQPWLSVWFHSVPYSKRDCKQGYKIYRL